MADDSNKRMLKENETRTKMLIRRMIYYWAIFAILRFLARNRASTITNVLHVLVFIVSTLICKKLCKMAQPRVRSDGKLIAGSNFLVGWGSYLCDMLYICLFVNMLILISKKMVWAFLLIPVILGIGIW